MSFVPLSAQTFSWGNSTDTSITPNFVAGDYWALNLSGAAAYAEIKLGYILNGGSVQYYTQGYADASGNYTANAQETTASLGSWQVTWYVNNVSVGYYTFEVIRLPSQLGVVSSSPSDCPGAYPYGVEGSIDYDIEDSGGNLVTSNNITLFPYFAWNAGGCNR